ncbi:MAG: carbohydrate-binding domain-containing protein [Erysipelotrichaceae bacterium]|nr:carbohydrate-binding domain-containing protein [Erysipelotrichaceae bacterium]
MMKRIGSLWLIIILMVSVLSGCNTDTQNEAGASPVIADFFQTDEEMFTKRDWKTDYNENNSIQIQLNGDSVTATSNSVQIVNTTITLTEEATYIISGTLNDGRIIVDAPKTAKLQLVLNGVNINNKNTAAIYILNADKVFLTLVKGSDNIIVNDGIFITDDENKIDAAIFSKQDLTMNGSGSLTVISSEGNGITSKDDLVITSGNYLITAAKHGLEANDSIRIANASFTIHAEKDGIHAENSEDESLGFIYLSSGDLKIEAKEDGMSASSYMQIVDGTMDIVTAGGSENSTKTVSDSWGGFKGNKEIKNDSNDNSMKGLKANQSMLISNGVITIDSADDAIHSNASIIINGGTFEIASGDDAIHADEALTITSGSIHITESYEGLEALTIDIQGGNIELVASDDGINAAGGNDSSGMTGGRGGRFSPSDKPDQMGKDRNLSSNSKIVISGGTLYIRAFGDGIDANGTLSITGGNITVVGQTQGDTSILDYDVSGVITDGTFVGTGSSHMAQIFSEANQGVIAVQMNQQSANTSITLKDESGQLILTHTPELSFQVVIISSPKLVSGKTYQLTIGSISSDVKAN